MASTLPLTGNGNITINSTTPADGLIKLANATSGNGNMLTIEGSNGATGNNNGGNIIITPGSKTGTGTTEGALNITDSSSRNNLSIRNDGRITLGYGPVSNPGASIIMVPSPTGTAAIDTTNIQDAIDQAAQNGGGTVVLQKGTYFLEAQTFQLYGRDYSCCIRLYGGVRLIGAGMLATILYAANSDCHVIMSDPAEYITGAHPNYDPKNGICIKDLQVLAGANSGSHTGVYLNGVINCLIENVFVNGNYGPTGNPGYHFNRGIHLKAWIATIINCFVYESYQGFNLSWNDDLAPNTPAGDTNAVEMVGCHYEGGILPTPGNGLIGCYINGIANHLSGCTIERRTISETGTPSQTVGVYITGTHGWGNTITGCYFEGWRVTFMLDGCSESSIIGGYMTAFTVSSNLIDPIQYLNGADAIDNCNLSQNIRLRCLQYQGGEWVFFFDWQAARDEIARIIIAPHGTRPDIGYNGNLVITKPAASGQYINIIRSGQYPWSIGMVHNTNNFAIGPGKATDSDFNNPYFVIRDENGNGNIGIGIVNPPGKLTVQGGTPDAGDLFNVNNASGQLIGRIYQDGSGHGVLHILDNSGSTVKIQLYSIGDSYFNGGNFGIGTNSPSSKLDVSGDVEVGSGDAFYLGAPTGTVGSWRITRSGNDLVFQRCTSTTPDVWTTKGVISA